MCVRFREAALEAVLRLYANPDTLTKTLRLLGVESGVVAVEGVDGS